MDYKEALAKVEKHVPKDNYMVISLGYANKYVLPYKDGVTLTATLAKAEQLHEPYNEQHRISEIERGKFEMNVMSHDEYTRFKIAALLGVTPDEVKAAEKAE